MAVISRFPFFRHLKSDPSSHVLHYRGGKKQRSLRGATFWFNPLSASVAELPCGDLEQSFLFHARSSDFQDMTAQGVITYRIAEPERCADRVDFSIHLGSGKWLESPLQKLSGILSQLAQQHAIDCMARTPVRELLATGVEAIRAQVAGGLSTEALLEELGLQIVSVRVSEVSPTSELEKALQASTREEIQQEADEATFQRRALAVEKERAIAENELQNRIELARREEELISQEGQNEKRRATEGAEALRIATESSVDRKRLESEAKAQAIRSIEKARVEAEQDRMAIYREMPALAMFGLAAQELARKLEKIEHLNLSPDLFGPMIQKLVEAGTERLARPEEA